jgi:hypothetical protein
MASKKSDLPLYNKEQDERPDNIPELDETSATVRPPGQGSYYYDDSTGYEVYRPDEDGENNEQSGEELIGKRNKGSGQSPDPLTEEH